MAVAEKLLQSFDHSQTFLSSLYFLAICKSLVFFWTFGLRWYSTSANHLNHCQTLYLQDKSQFSRLFLTEFLNVTDDPGVGQDYPVGFALSFFIVSCQRLQMVSVPLCIAFILWVEPRVTWVHMNTGPRCLINRTCGCSLSFVSRTVT